MRRIGSPKGNYLNEVICSRLDDFSLREKWEDLDKFLVALM